MIPSLIFIQFRQQQEQRMSQKQRKYGLAVTQQLADDMPALDRTNSSKMYSQASQHYSSQRIIQNHDRSSHTPNRSAEKKSIFKKNSSSSETQQMREKMMSLMREQIQISMDFYSKKMKQVLKDQSKEILMLRNRIEDNEKQLKEKDKLLEELHQTNKVETPKKKISITTLAHLKNSPENQSYAKISRKINSLEENLTFLESAIHKKHQHQKQLSLKIQIVEKSLIKYFASKLASIDKTVSLFISDKESVIACLKDKVNEGEKGGEEKEEKEVKLRMNKIHAHLSELKEEVMTFSRKEFKYENQQVEKIKRKVISLTENVRNMEEVNENKSALFKSEAPMSNRQETKIKQVFIQQPVLPKKAKLLNQIQPKQVRLIKAQTMQQTHNSYLKETELTRNESCIAPSEISRSQTNLAKERVVYRGSKAQEEEEDIGMSYNEYENVDSCYSEGEYEGEESDFTDYEEDEGNEERLVEILMTMGYPLPVSVEIDQTGYLKSVKDGMYIVDKNDDGFALSEGEVRSLVEQGLIRVTNYY